MKYIIKIVESNSFSEAAENLFISQPALSKAVKRMEEKLGFKIFKKVGTKNKLTPQGLKLIENIRPVLLSYSKFEESLKDINSIKPVVNYGVIPYYCTPFTTMFLYRFKEKFPNIIVNMIEAPKDTLLAKLINGDIDVAMTESLLESPKVKIYSGFQDDVSVAVGPKNPLYEESQLTFRNLKSYSFNFVTSSEVLRKQIMNGCSSAGFIPKIAYQSSQIGILLENTKSEKSICVLNRPMIYDNIVVNQSISELKIIPLDPAPQCYCYVYCRSGISLSKEILDFLDEITEDLTIDTKERII